MMKIAIAGTNGFAQFIAYYLTETTSHSFVFLSRTNNQGLKDRDWQVLTVSYDSKSSLAYSLVGMDIVISTICGSSQLALIEAAATAQVRLFIPSAFSGPQQCSPQLAVRSSWVSTVERLVECQKNSSMRFTIFTCGIFFERFGPGGLNRIQISSGTNPNAGIGGEGEFLFDFRAGLARIPHDASGRNVYVTMTSARDVARYLVAAIQANPDLDSWPKEMKMHTERLSMTEFIGICARTRGTPLNLSQYNAASLSDALVYAHAIRDTAKELRLEQFIAAAEGAFDSPSEEINLPEQILIDARVSTGEIVGAERFEPWLTRIWSEVLLEQLGNDPSTAATSAAISRTQSATGGALP